VAWLNLLHVILSEAKDLLLLSVITVATKKQILRRCAPQDDIRETGC
jgi:hypothetical protein